MVSQILEDNANNTKHHYESIVKNKERLLRKNSGKNWNLFYESTINISSKRNKTISHLAHSENKSISNFLYKSLIGGEDKYKHRYTKRKQK